MVRQRLYVIIGNGIAGITAAEMLRAEDRACDITIVADDPYPAYYRPALKDFLGGRLPEAKLWARPATFYREQHVRFLPARVVAIHPQQHTIQLHNGAALEYQRLLLANGARTRTLSCPGLNLVGVSTLRTVADYQEILRRLENVKRVVVCGSGTLALESAETLRHRGYQVTHLLRGNLLWSEVLDPVASDIVLQEEQRDGIEVRMREEIAEIVGRDGQVCGVRTRRGEQIPCELVLIAIGIEPLIDFIRAGGVACGRGVKVDSCMRTNIPDIYAAGDVIETTDTLTGHTRVLGQWFPAIQQAQIAASNMLTSQGRPAQAGLGMTPAHFYNATFLYGLDFVSVGLSTRQTAPGFQELVAKPQARDYRKVTLYNGRIVGALLLGDRSQGLAFKRAVDHQVNLAPIAHKLFAEGFDLEAWLSEQGVAAPHLALQRTNTHETFTTREQRALATNMLAELGEADAYLVPILHSKVHVFTTEMQLNRGEQAQTLTVGRQAGVSWLLEHSSISRLHAEIACAGGTYVLRDVGSSNGTFVNGSPLERGSDYQLGQHDHVRFGDVQFRFELRSRNSSGRMMAITPAAIDGFTHLQGTELQSNASRLIPDSILNRLSDAPTLVVVGPDTPPQILPLTDKQRYLLGRGPQNDIIFADPSTSHQHAEIFNTPDGFHIRDLNSRYGVFVNRLKINNIFHLSHGDRVVMGNILVYFSHPQRYQQEQLGNETLVTRPTPRVTVGAAEGKKPVMVGMEHRKETEPLEKERLQFEIDMCIGCNRCMDACPVPVSETVTIATLNYATVTDTVTPTIERFTHECIMCGSCVPVCPVDNHRDLLMLSLKQRIGASWEGRPDMNRVAQVLPLGWSLSLLLQNLGKQSIFREAKQVPDTYLLHLVAASTQRILAPGEMLLREGEYGRDLYLLLQGQMELTTTDRENTELAVAILQPGEYVGEDGMLRGRPYRASVRAKTPALLFQVPEQIMQRLMELVPSVRQHFERFGHARSLHAILKHIELFEEVTDADIQALIRQTSIRHYERSEHLFAEDSKGRPARETLHILLEGFVKVARQKLTGAESGKSSIIAYRQGGDYFAGGLDLLGDGHAVTVTTINRCQVAEVPRQAVIALFQRYPAVEQRFTLRMQEYLKAAAAVSKRSTASRSKQRFIPASTPADPSVLAGLHELVSDGVVEGTEVLVIDLDKCIHCNECEEACERRHGHSRMNRKGMVIGNISVATACRQCHDPVCMLCSRAGIARHPNGEVYITESCIGCGICAERCPYGAISIVSIEDEPVARNTWQRFSGWFAKATGTGRTHKSLPVINPAVADNNHAAPGPLDPFPTRSGYDELRKKIAIKCDLCAGYRDQACVEACPVGAAIRIQPTKFFGSTEEILRRRTN